MGSTTPKQFLMLGELPMLIHTILRLQQCPQVGAVVLVVPQAELSATTELIADHGLSNIVGPVCGGSTRQQSVHRGLHQVPDGFEMVAIHDAVRPFPDPDTLTRAIELARQGQGVVVGRAATDTIKQVDESGRIVATPDRATLWHAFTPQVFPLTMIRQAYDRAADGGYVGTDDASLAEWNGDRVELIPGERESLKVTVPQDLATARAWQTSADGSAGPPSGG